MLAVLLTVHIIACIVLVISVMLQRSEGGALGMSGGGTGGLISGRGAASALVKVTMGLAAVFFFTSITMTRLNNDASRAPSVLEQQTAAPVDPFAPAPVNGGVSVPASPAPAGAAPVAPGASPAPAAPAPAAPAVDPLAPKASTPAAPAATAPAPAAPAPAPAAPAPQTGGSNN